MIVLRMNDIQRNSAKSIRTEDPPVETICANHEQPASSENIFHLESSVGRHAEDFQGPRQLPAFPSRAAVQRISSKQSPTVIADVITSQLVVEEPKTKTEDDNNVVNAAVLESSSNEPPAIPSRMSVQRIRSRQSPSVIADVLTSQLLAAEPTCENDDSAVGSTHPSTPKTSWSSSSAIENRASSPRENLKTSPSAVRKTSPKPVGSRPSFTRNLHGLQREQRRSTEDEALTKLIRDRLERANELQTRTCSVPSLTNTDGPQSQSNRRSRAFSTPPISTIGPALGDSRQDDHNRPAAAFPLRPFDMNSSIITAELVPSADELENQIKEVVTEEVRREINTMRGSMPPPLAEAVVLDQSSQSRDRQESPFQEGSTTNKTEGQTIVNGPFCIFVCGLIMVGIGLTVGLALGLNNNKSTSSPRPPADKERDCMILNYPDISGARDDYVLTTVPDTICYERIPYQGLSKSCPSSIPRPLGSGVSNLVAESQLWFFPEADISFVNAGQTKLDICPGNFTRDMANALLPYDNTVVILMLSGSELLRVLEQALDHISLEFSMKIGNGGGYPYGAGIRYWVNMMESFPNRLTAVQVNPQLETDWGAIELQRNYTIATSSYLANGGDGYTYLANVHHEDTKILVRDVFMDFCQEKENLVDPPNSRYSTQDYIHDPRLFDIVYSEKEP